MCAVPSIRVWPKRDAPLVSTNCGSKVRYRNTIAGLRRLTKYAKPYNFARAGPRRYAWHIDNALLCHQTIHREIGEIGGTRYAQKIERVGKL
jgi:hypothetical protein